MDEVIKREDDTFDFPISNIMLVLFGVLALAVVFQVTPLAKSVKAYYSSQLFQGENDPRILRAKGEIQWIFLDPPWVNAFIINKGPNNVYIGLNQRDNLFVIEPNGTRTITRTGAEERIHAIFYHCSAHETATLDVTGTY